MKRKVVKQGSATLMISLPSKWTKKNNIHKGDSVYITEKNDLLQIKGKEAACKKETTIELTSEAESSMRTIITNTYRLGFDKITIKNIHKDNLHIIKEIVEKHLPGFDIIKKEGDNIIIESITEPSTDKLKNIFSKILMNIEELFEVAEKMFKGEYEEYEYTERKIKEFDNFCRRAISKSNPPDAVLQWAFHNELIHAQRQLYHMLNYQKKSRTKVDKICFDLLKECKEIYNNLQRAYYNKDIKLLEQIHNREKDLRSKEDHELLNKSKNTVIICYLLSVFRGFYLTSSPLMGSILNNLEEKKQKP